MRTIFGPTYAAYLLMVYQSTYDAILATPVAAESLAFGEIIWAVTKGAIDCVFILPLVIIFGSATSLFTPLAIVPLLFGCIFLGSLGLSVTARVFEIDNFNIFFALFFSTLFICGAWFPIETLPTWLKIFAYILPTTSVIDLTRACLTGNFLSKHYFEAIYLFIVSFALLEFALRSIRQRMVL